MIKVNKTLKELDDLAEIFYGEVISRLDTANRVVGQVVGSAEKQAFYQEVFDQLPLIIKGRPDQLETLTIKLQPLLKAYKDSLLVQVPTLTNVQKTAIRQQLKAEFEDVFDYGAFSSKANWAYNHVAQLDMNVCPYCNMQYTFTIRSSRGMARPQFDHFFKKSTYPYFALSFYNLVPSCYVCNASLKGQHVFLPSTHIHPFVEGVEDTLVFKTNVLKTDFLAGKTGFTVSLHPTDAPPAGKLDRAVESATVFHIDEQYRFHEAYAGNIIRMGYFYADTNVSELLKDYHRSNGATLFQDDTEILEMLFGNFVREGTLHERVLAKLTNNISREIGVVK